MNDTAPVEILVAAFEPFEGRRRNRSWEAVRRLPARAGLLCLQLPVDFAQLPCRMADVLARHPRALLLVGEAARRCVSVEQVALNIADSDRGDNAGAVLHDRPLDASAGSVPLAVRASWDARAVARSLREAGIRAEPSFHAGTFACNASLYLALRAVGEAAAAGATPTAVGFLHVPRARWPLGPRLSRLVRAVEIAARALRACAGSPSSGGSA
jgi:pyroglutamyl-peptidase